MWFPRTRRSIFQNVVAAIGRYWKQARRDRRLSQVRSRRGRRSWDCRGALVHVIERLEPRTLLTAVIDFQNFDGVTAPAFPVGWQTSGTINNPWGTVAGGLSDTAPNHAFVADISTTSDSSLVSPTFTAAPSAQISFRHSYLTEAGLDGGVLEISINGGAFTDIITAGGSFAAGGYDSTLGQFSGNPLAGRDAWSGNSFGYIDATVNLPAAAYGQAVQVRWRMGTDSGGSSIGWRVDTIRLFGDADFGDAPLPYPVTLSENGARHLAAGPTLGATRDAEADGTHSANATSDGADDDGVTFGTIQIGALGTTATVNVAGAPSGAKLDAWIDFNGDGNWGGAGEQIAASVSVVNGVNVISFDVPSAAKDGTTFARFRLSTAGNLGAEGSAADGEVEDYAVTITPPAAASGLFGGQNTVTTGADGARSIFAADMDGDGDLDMLSASYSDDKIAWYENNGSQNFTAHNVNTPDPDAPTTGANGNADGAFSVTAADVDGDGDLDVLSASVNDDKIAWYENDGSQTFTPHTISTESN